jgi:hypothetical protein
VDQILHNQLHKQLVQTCVSHKVTHTYQRRIRMLTRCFPWPFSKVS